MYHKYSRLTKICRQHIENKKTLDKLTDQPRKLIALQRGEVTDVLVSGDKSDLVVVDPHDSTTKSKSEAPIQPLNQLPMVTNLAGARSA
jgi:N-acyl-D-aspartate/D-glutamate deacylase